MTRPDLWTVSAIMANWQRPDSPDYPKVYKKWEGKIDVNGKRRVFWIQDLTEEFIDEAVRLYTTGFVVDEPINSCLRVYENKHCVEEFGELWRELLKQKLSLVCLTLDDTGKMNVCGVNCLYIVYPEEGKKIFNDQTTIKICNFLDFVSQQRDPFKEFGLDQYLSAMGLYVHPQYRGEGLGQEILNARILLGRDLGIKGSLTVFTSFISQKQAERAGFKDYVVIDYEQLGKESPEFDFNGVHKHSKFGKLMYMLY